MPGSSLFFKFIFLLTFLWHGSAQSHSLPFSTHSTRLTIWNGADYFPFLEKGINLGVAVPGTFPSELLVIRMHVRNRALYIQQSLSAARQSNTNNSNLGLRDWAQGLYLVRIQADVVTIYSKLVIQKPQT